MFDAAHKISGSLIGSGGKTPDPTFFFLIEHPDSCGVVSIWLPVPWTTTTTTSNLYLKGSLLFFFQLPTYLCSVVPMHHHVFVPLIVYDWYFSLLSPGTQRICLILLNQPLDKDYLDVLWSKGIYRYLTHRQHASKQPPFLPVLFHPFSALCVCILPFFLPLVWQHSLACAAFNVPNLNCCHVIENAPSPWPLSASPARCLFNEVEDDITYFGGNLSLCNSSLVLFIFTTNDSNFSVSKWHVYLTSIQPQKEVQAKMCLNWISGGPFSLNQTESTWLNNSCIVP